MLIVPKPQVSVLARHDFVAVAFKKSSHLPSTNGPQRKPFLFSHYGRSIRFALAPHTRAAGSEDLPASVGNVGSARPLTQTALIGSVADKPSATRVASATR